MAIEKTKRKRKYRVEASVIVTGYIAVWAHSPAEARAIVLADEECDARSRIVGGGDITSPKVTRVGDCRGRLLAEYH